MFTHGYAKQNVGPHPRPIWNSRSPREQLVRLGMLADRETSQQRKSIRSRVTIKESSFPRCYGFILTINLGEFT